MRASHHRSPRRTINRRTVLAAVPAIGLAATMASTSGSPAQAAAATDGAKTVAYVEVNTNDLAHVGDYLLDGTDTPVFDLAIIFAANIGRADGRAQLQLNDRVQWTLDNADTQIRTLQDRGIKVLLSILGGHQGLGLANFTAENPASAFADQVAQVIDRHGLDGVDLDDEFADYGTDGTADPNPASFVDLTLNLRRTLGDDRLITLYAVGPAAQRTVDGPRRAGDTLDYAWNPYYGSWNIPDVPGLGPEKLAGAAIDVGETPTDTIRRLADQTRSQDLGVMIAYNVGSDSTTAISAMTQGLYGRPTRRRA